jgi:hypothetical protein
VTLDGDHTLRGIDGIHGTTVANAFDVDGRERITQAKGTP